MYSNYDEKTDTLSCPLCGKDGLQVLKGHLSRSHKTGVTYKEFQEKYPNCKTLSNRVLKERTEYAIKMNSNTEFRKVRSEKMEKLYNDKKYLCRISSVMKEMHQDPKFKKKHADGIKKLNQNKDYTKKRDLRMKEHNTDPEFIQKRLDGIKKINQDPEFIQKRLDGIKKINQDPDYIKRNRKTSSETMTRLNQDPSFSKKRDERASLNSWGRKSYYYSEKINKKIFCASSYEERVYKILDKMAKIVSYTPQPFTIPYFFEEKRKSYRPDILVLFNSGLTSIIEIKPERLVNTDKNKAKFNSAITYCNKLENNIFEFIIWTEEDIEYFEEKYKM